MVSDSLPVTIADVEAAAAALARVVVRTPCAESQTLSAITGTRVWCKLEGFQYTASFKERGARWFLDQLDAGARSRGVVAASAGNHAQGVAHHAALLGIPATIVMPHGTPFTKVSRTEVLGARVVVEGDGFHDARAHAITLAAESGATFVPAFDDPHVIAGQGTVALEILEQAPELDTLVVPVGGGGLLAGCAVAVQARRPDVRVVGVQVDRYAGLAHALALGDAAAPSGGMTIAEGIAVVEPGALTTAIARQLVDDIVVVTEDDVERAVGLYLDIEKVVVEGAGAASLAALLAHPELFAGHNCVLVASGANIDPRVLSSVLLRSLARNGRLVRLRMEVPDRPGALANVASLIGAAGGNIVDVDHHRDRLGVPLREAVLEVSVETRDTDHAARIRRDLEANGFRQADA
ncbi:MAG TPA: threonine ammonia-lyase [Acidimicrobiia bacterium]|jgi:threonine dehydratase